MVIEKIMTSKQLNVFNTLALILAVILTASMDINIAQSATLTPQQLEMLKGLSAEEQNALAINYGIDLKTIATSQNPAQPSLSAAQSSKILTTNTDRNQLETSTNQANKMDQLEEDKENRNQQGPLKQFGYSLFSNTPDAFTPAIDIPPPDSYVLGPGDNLVVQLYGKENNSYSLTVNREGQIQLPEIGPITLAGLTFTEARSLLMDTVNKQMIGLP